MVARKVVTNVFACIAHTKKKTAFALSLFAGLALGNVAGAATADDCDRQCLKKFADLYFVALAAHDPAKLPVAANVKFTENNAVLKLGEGHWKAGGKESYRMQIFDPEQGGIGIEAVIPSASGPAVMALRLKIEHQLISEVDAVVTYKASGPIFGPEKLAGTEPAYFWTRTIRPTERNSRYELIAATEGYWRAFETTGTPEYIRAPLLPDTLRTENGLQTTDTTMAIANVPANLLPKGFVPPPDGRIPTGTATEQFDGGIFKGMKIAERRYPVVDVEVGAVLSMARFGATPEGAVVAEFFAITQGKIRQIAAVFTAPTKPSRSPWY